MTPETPPPPPPVPPMPQSGYTAPPPGPPPNSYPTYTPPPRSGMPAWGWVLIGCAGCGVLCIPIFIAIFFPVFASARSAARSASCLSNTKIIALGEMMYLQDYDEQMPIAASWQDTVMPYVKKEEDFRCPEIHPGSEGWVDNGTTYAFNNTLDMMQVSRVADPRTTVLQFETTNFTRNSNDALTSLPTPPRHRKSVGAGNNLSFVDGHAEFWPEANALPESKILPAGQ